MARGPKSRERIGEMSERSRVALVTGASSGIGRATAAAFVRRGYATVLVDRDEALGKQAEEELRALGECMFLTCDVTDDARVESTIATAVAAYGRIDAAFNAAGIDGATASTAECTIENFDRIMSVNLRGLWFCLRHEIRQMLKQGGGAVVNCASTAGLVGVAGLPAYVASKHGVVGLTKSAALDYARSNIRVNAVCPGMIDTPMWHRSIPPDITAQLLATDPSGRLGHPAEIAEAVIWLCDPAASFVTGQALAVDGGMTVR
jgi:NAD(P)-dependent dehydrogenase (short-subunit alcohol dehydrogenase family)